MGLALSVRDLVVEGDRGRELLRIGELDIPAGARIGIRGPSGAGKSTLLYALAGLVPLKAGSVAWGGREISGLSAAERARFRRKSVGMVFQDFNLLYDRTMEDNLLFVLEATGWKDKSRKVKRIDEVLGLVGLKLLLGPGTCGLSRWNRDVGTCGAHHLGRSSQPERRCRSRWG